MFRPSDLLTQGYAGVGQMKYDLDSQEQATALMHNLWPKVKASLANGKKLTLEIKEASKSREQEEKYHAIIGDIAKQAQHMGAKWDAETWKRLLVDKYCRETGLNSKIMANLDNDGLVQLGFQTRKFTKEQASEFVEFLQAWAADNGVTLND
jgi:DICT domain-containing protein